MAIIRHNLPPLKITGDATVLHRPGVVRLDGYPLLVHAPDQHGQGVRTEDVGVLVEDVCRALAVTPDYAAVAAQFKTTVNHVRQAVAYANAAGFAKS